MNEQKSVTFNNNNKGLTLEIYDPKQLTMNGQLWHFITTSRSIRILFCSSLFWLRRIFCLRVKVITGCKLSNAIQTVTVLQNTALQALIDDANIWMTRWLYNIVLWEKKLSNELFVFLTVMDIPVYRAIHCIHGALTTSAQGNYFNWGSQVLLIAGKQSMVCTLTAMTSPVCLCFILHTWPHVPLPISSMVSKSSIVKPKLWWTYKNTVLVSFIKKIPLHGINVCCILHIIVQFHPWFVLFFPLFLGMVMHDNEFKTRGNTII